MTKLKLTRDHSHTQVVIRVSSFIRHFFIALLVLSAPVQAQRPSEWHPAAETAVVFNPDFPGSAALADYYAKKRGIPKERVIGLRCPQEDSISRAEFEALLRKPLLQTFQSKGWWIVEPPVQDSTPARLRVQDEASVDSELTALGLKQPPLKGGLLNPYFDQPVRFPQSAQSGGMLIVGRLDGPDDETVRRMIDDALFAEETGLRGRAVIDLAQKTGAYQEGEDWLKRSAELYKRAGIPVFIDRAPDVLREAWPLPDTILYFGWYTDRISGALAAPTFRFKRGAIACHLHSFSASVIRSKGQAWAVPLLTQGAAVAFGNVFEPYLSLTLHFDVFNQRLL
ncbi:MAG: TIGR03790 family protein, partial [Verrucomicrobiaceae bacterium]|nr:TIGR03790 family protein [Verrucomicrobiaceae bacterium]